MSQKMMQASSEGPGFAFASRTETLLTFTVEEIQIQVSTH